MFKYISVSLIAGILVYVIGLMQGMHINPAAADVPFPAQLTMVNVATSSGEIDVRGAILGGIINPAHRTLDGRIACTVNGKTAAYLSSKNLAAYHLWVYKQHPGGLGSLRCIAKLPANTKIEYILAVQP